MKTRHVVPILIAPLVLCWAALRGFADGTPHPLADDSDNFGVTLEPFGDTAASVWSGVVAVGFVVALATLVARPGTRLHRARRPVIVGAVVLALLTLDHTLLMLLGYLPMLAVRLLTGNTDGTELLASPGLVVQLAAAAGAASLALALRRRTRAGGSASPEQDLAQAAERTRRWTLVAIEAPLAYAVTRLLMFVDLPGFGGLEWEGRVAGLGLALAAIGGAVLTWGLVRPWGERFPRWMIGLAGRRVPVDLAVVPALVVAGLVLAASRGLVVGVVDAPGEAWDNVAEAPLVSLPHLLWPVWGVALGLAALAYQRRRTLAEIPDAVRERAVGAGR